MRHMYKENSTIHQKLELLEMFLQKNDIYISGIESITINSVDCTIEDSDTSGTQHATLPRSYDSQRIYPIKLND